MITVRWRTLFEVCKDTWPTGMPIVGVVIAFFLAWYFSSTLANAIRVAGMLLQLGGLVLVGRGLSKKRKTFGHPSIPNKIFGWSKRVAAVFARPRVVSAQARAVAEAGVAAEAVVIRRAPSGVTVEERVLVLEQTMDSLRDDLNTNVQELRREIPGVKRDIKGERQERLAGDQRMARKIEEVTIGDFHLEIIGLFWLFLGVIGTSIPTGLAEGWHLICRAIYPG